MKKARVTYPFVPKSAAWLSPGEFWALPLSDGTYGCGRVIQVPPKEVRRNSMHFLGALLDWHSAEKPTSEAIAGCQCLKQSDMHIRAVTRVGGEILGIRELELDGIKPWLFRGAEFWRNSTVKNGLIPVRPQQPEDDVLPVLVTSGMNVLRSLAEERYVEKRRNVG